jgi:hypothetical protein
MENAFNPHYLTWFWAETGVPFAVMHEAWALLAMAIVISLALYGIYNFLFKVTSKTIEWFRRRNAKLAY